MKPLPKAVQALRRAARVTKAVCVGCDHDTPARCCSALFCGIVEKGLVAINEPVPAKPGLYGAPFLGPNGCVVPPELRPGCAAYACEERLGPAARAERNRQLYLALEDPTVSYLWSLAAAASRRAMGRAP